MRYIVAVLLVVVLTVAPAVAGMNPECKFFVTFADTSSVTYQNLADGARVDPVMYTAFDAHFGILDYGCFTTISFMIENTPGMSSPVAYDNLLPGNLAIGAYETGVTLASTIQLDSSVQGPFYFFATGHYFYLNVPGEIKIVDHPEFPRWVVSCNDEVDYYCVWQNGGVAMDAVVVEAECYGDVPVESSSWGAIKSLYR